MSQFTKIAIMKTFVELLNEMPLDKITVTDIVDRCGVNRNTFYYYYQDIYALLDEVFQIERKKIVDDTSSFDSWVDGFRSATKFAVENKKGIYHIYNSINRELLERYLYDVVGKNMQSYVEKKAANTNAGVEEISVISEFYTYALVGSMLQWLSRGMKDDPNAYIATASRLLEGNIEYTLSKCVGKEKSGK